MRDLSDGKDVQLLVETFYEKALKDEVIGYLFTDIAQLDLPEHLPRICSFWESILFGNLTYQGNPMEVHQHLHQKEPLVKEHFERWLALFTATVDELFAGVVANRAKTRATSIATVMQIKLAE